MTLKECYAALGGDYEEAISRLSSERIVQKFVIKFLNDSSFELLCRSMEEQNYDEAFRAAHTIKGVCQNLSFTQLSDSSSRLTEALRSGWNPENMPLVEQVKRDYQQVTEAIRTLQAEIEGK